MKKGWIGLAVLLVLLCPAHGQEIWRHVDDEGHIRYADRPFPHAVRVEAPGMASWLARAEPSSDSRSAQDPSPAATASSIPARAGALAPALKIAYPAANETVWGAGGELEVRLLVNASQEDEARLSIQLDGAEASWHGRPPVVRLENVWRGEHRLRARLLDSQGGELAVSEEVRFFKRERTVAAAGDG